MWTVFRRQDARPNDRPDALSPLRYEARCRVVASHRGTGRGNPSTGERLSQARRWSQACAAGLHLLSPLFGSNTAPATVASLRRREPEVPLVRHEPGRARAFGAYVPYGPPLSRQPARGCERRRSAGDARLARSSEYVDARSSPGAGAVPRERLGRSQEQSSCLSRCPSVPLFAGHESGLDDALARLCRVPAPQDVCSLCPEAASRSRSPWRPSIRYEQSIPLPGHLRLSAHRCRPASRVCQAGSASTKL